MCALGKLWITTSLGLLGSSRTVKATEFVNARGPITVFGLFQWDNKLPGILVKIFKITRKLFSPLELFTKYHRAWIQPLRLQTVANKNGAGHFTFLLIDCLRSLHNIVGKKCDYDSNCKPLYSCQCVNYLNI